jgi:hypothetical protein
LLWGAAASCRGGPCPFGQMPQAQAWLGLLARPAGKRRVHRCRRWCGLPPPASTSACTPPSTSWRGRWRAWRCWCASSRWKVGGR